MRKKYKPESWEEFEDIEKKMIKEMMMNAEPTITGQVRITAGKAKNIKLDIPKKTRPLTDRMKTQIFDTLQRDIYKRDVLDLYAGSGSFGLEALSRGAKSATFVDAAKQAERILDENIRKCGFLAESTLIRSKADEYLNKAINEEEEFEIIFIDPPYKIYNKKFSERIEQLLLKSLQLLPGVRDENTKLFKGVIILKHPRTYSLEGIKITGLRALDTYTYGMNAITIYVIDFDSLKSSKS